MALTKFPIEFVTAPSTTPQAVIKTLDGQAWNTSGTPALEAYSSAHYANYAIQLTQLGTSRSWYLSVPATLPAGNYNVTVSTPAVTATPVESTDTIVGNGSLNWDGTNLLDTYTISSRIPSALGANGNIKADLRDLVGVSTPVTNLGIVFNTDFATNYDATNHLFCTNAKRLNGTALTGKDIGASVNLNYAQVAPAWGVSRDTLGMILYRDHLAPHSRKPANWPIRFTMNADNAVDIFTNIVMVWYDDITTAPFWGLNEQMTEALRPYAYSGYWSVNNSSYGMIGLNQDGRMVLLLNDSGAVADEWYGSYSFDGTQWTDLATTGKDPTPLSDSMGDWDLATAPGHGSIVVSFSNYVFSDTEVAVKTKTDFLPSATAGASGGLFISGTNAQTTITGGFGANSITATSLASDAITDAKVASDVTIASVTGAVGSVTGNVGGNVVGSAGSIIGNVGGNVTGSVGSLSTQAKSDVWANGTRTLTAGTNIVLAKGTGITGFNDIAATDVWANASRTLTAFAFSVTVGTNNDKTGYGLADGAITTAKIADDAITDAKIASDVTIASVTGAVGSVTATVSLSGSERTSIGNALLAIVNSGSTVSSQLSNASQALGAASAAASSADSATNAASLAYTEAASANSKLNANFVQFVSANTSNKTIDDIGTGGGGSSNIDPSQVDEENEWRFESEDQLTAINQIRQIVGFKGLLAMNMDVPLPDDDTLASALVATVSPSSGITIATPTVLNLSPGRRRILVNVTNTTVAGTYTVVLKGATVDSQEFYRRGVFVLESLTGT